MSGPVGVVATTSNNTSLMYRSVNPAPMLRSSTRLVLSFSSCFSQNRRCARARDPTPPPYFPPILVASRRCTACRASRYPTNAVVCVWSGKSSFGGPTHTHASGERMASPQSGSGLGSMAGHLESIDRLSAAAASTYCLGSERSSAHGDASAMHNVTLPPNATRSAANIGADTSAQGYITQCSTSSPPRPHATSRCILRKASVCRQRFSMRIRVAGSPSGATASTDFSSGAHGASRTFGRRFHSPSRRRASLRIVPSGQPSRSHAPTEVDAEEARAATTRGARRVTGDDREMRGANTRCCAAVAILRRLPPVVMDKAKSEGTFFNHPHQTDGSGTRDRCS